MGRSGKSGHTATLPCLKGFGSQSIILTGVLVPDFVKVASLLHTNMARVVSSVSRWTNKLSSVWWSHTVHPISLGLLLNVQLLTQRMRKTVSRNWIKSSHTSRETVY